MDREKKKKKFNPWLIEKFFTQAMGNKPVSIRSNNGSEFSIEISRENESNVLSTIIELKFLEYQLTFECYNPHLGTK